jgi:hypothetical protein
MMQKLALALMACSAVGCASQPTGGTSGVLPAGCEGSPTTWKLRVLYNGDGEPIAVASADESQHIPDPARLVVKECDKVEISVKKGLGRTGMAAFDKREGFRSPGGRPAYLSRGNKIIIPIDDRDGSGTEEFEYSIHIDCQERGSRCRPLDPMIKVER